MDTGPSPDVVLHTAEVMGVDLSKISAIFLSHGHYDHTGGLVSIMHELMAVDFVENTLQLRGLVDFKQLHAYILKKLQV